MQWIALLAAGFSGLTTGGFGAGAPMDGVRAANVFDAPAVYAPFAVEPQAPEGAGIFIPIHKPSNFVNGR